MTHFIITLFVRSFLFFGVVTDGMLITHNKRCQVFRAYLTTTISPAVKRHRQFQQYRRRLCTVKVVMLAIIQWLPSQCQKHRRSVSWHSSNNSSSRRALWMTWVDFNEQSFKLNRSNFINFSHPMQIGELSSSSASSDSNDSDDSDSDSGDSSANNHTPVKLTSVNTIMPSNSISNHNKGV